MDNKLIKTTIDNHVALVMLDNQPVNAQSREFVEELISVFDELNETPAVRVIVMASNCKVFSAGADIKSRSKVGQGAPGDTYRHLRRTREVGFSIMESNKPVIAAVNGAALGAGMLRLHSRLGGRGFRAARDRCRPDGRRTPHDARVPDRADAAHGHDRLARSGAGALSPRAD